MARDQSGGANPSPEECAAGLRAGRKHLGADGFPQAAPTPASGPARAADDPETGRDAEDEARTAPPSRTA